MSQRSDDLRAEFARRLQEAMILKGWSQSELARRAQPLCSDHIGRDLVSHYIRGKMLPTPNRLEAISKALETRPEQLLPTRGKLVAGDGKSLEVRDLGDGTCWFSFEGEISPEKAKAIQQILLEEDRTGKR